MNTKLLKQKILDLAIRGKLSQQLKSDGTARELLEQISSKVSSSSSTLSSPRRRGSPSSSAAKTIIPLDKSEAPFEIPANWEWVRLGDVASDFQYGSAEKSQVEGKVAVLRMGNINRQGQIDYGDLVYTSNDAEIAKYLLNKNDVLFNRTNSPEWVGKTAIYKGEIPAIYAGYIIRIRPHFNSDYLNYLMCSDYERNWSKEVKTDGVHQSNINAQKLIAFAIPLPPLAEQQRIVAKIEEAFAEIDAIEKNKELLKTHIKQTRQKILDLAIHGKLVPQDENDEPASVLLERITRDNPHYEKMGLDERRKTKDERGFKDKCHSREGGNLLAPISKDEIPFDIPENWIWCRLKDIANYGECDNVEVKHIPETAWILELEDIEKDSGKILHFFSKSERQINGVRHQFEKGDVLYSKLRTYLNKVLVASNDGYCTTEIMPIKTTFISNHYLCMVLRSRYFLDYTAMCGYGVKMPRLSTNDAKNGLIPLPPLNEQFRIVAKIEELFSALDQMERNLV
ncbi:MAG: restriction endonuclease subunit S [Fibrobacter sp.]|nr:restriction endonuclease subunit S [Fibrobacter sp.]